MSYVSRPCRALSAVLLACCLTVPTVRAQQPGKVEVAGKFSTFPEVGFHFHPSRSVELRASAGLDARTWEKRFVATAGVLYRWPVAEHLSVHAGVLASYTPARLPFVERRLANPATQFGPVLGLQRSFGSRVAVFVEAVLGFEPALYNGRLGYVTDASLLHSGIGVVVRPFGAATPSHAGAEGLSVGPALSSAYNEGRGTLVTLTPLQHTPGRFTLTRNAAVFHRLTDRIDVSASLQAHHPSRLYGRAIQAELGIGHTTRFDAWGLRTRLSAHVATSDLRHANPSFQTEVGLFRQIALGGRLRLYPGLAAMPELYVREHVYRVEHDPAPDGGWDPVYRSSRLFARAEVRAPLFFSLTRDFALALTPSYVLPVYPQTGRGYRRLTFGVQLGF